uniref:Transmembrane protein n=1 Tax=Panagrellus redivivus TaxID=6233 RepID=A0A7E4VB66_PANRE
MANQKQLNNKERQQLQLRQNQQPIAQNQRNDPDQADESQMNDDNSTIAANEHHFKVDRAQCAKWLRSYLAGLVLIFFFAYLCGVISYDGGFHLQRNSMFMPLCFVVFWSYWAYSMGTLYVLIGNQ